VSDQKTIDTVAFSDGNLVPLSFSKKFEYDSADNHQLIMQVLKDAAKNRTTLHMLTVDGNPYGFLSRSLQCSQFQKKEPQKKILNVDYLFVNKSLRKRRLPEFDGMKTSEFLVSLAINIAYRIKQFVPIEYIAAEPAHDSITPLYTDAGFKKLGHTDNVLFLKL
jgi:hypothetical protein